MIKVSRLMTMPTLRTLEAGAEVDWVAWVVGAVPVDDVGIEVGLDYRPFFLVCVGVRNRAWTREFVFGRRNLDIIVLFVLVNSLEYGPWLEYPRRRMAISGVVIEYNYRYILMVISLGVTPVYIYFCKFRI